MKLINKTMLPSVTPQQPSHLAGYLVEILNASMTFFFNPIQFKDMRTSGKSGGGHNHPPHFIIPEFKWANNIHNIHFARRIRSI